MNASASDSRLLSTRDGDPSGAPRARGSSVLAVELRPYQQLAVEDAVMFVERSVRMPAHLSSLRKLYSAPTGTGKSVVILSVRERLAGYTVQILTPSLEVIRGFLEKLGESPDVMTAAKLAEAAAAHGIATPITYRNRLLKGESPPDVVIYDEGHHASPSAETSELLLTLCADAVWLAYTATPYRGTPQGTRELRATWGEPHVIIDLQAAVAGGYVSLPECVIEPLLDDDEIKVNGGEFTIQSATAAMAAGSRVQALAALVAMEWTRPCPTVVVLPSLETARALEFELGRVDVATVWVHGSTPATERARCYASCRDVKAVLLSVQILAEGVDFPWLARIIDASPTLSPVAWVQRLGRCMRPKSPPPRYVCTNRNLERHAYLLQGLLPREKVAAAQQAFPTPSKRSAARAVGLEGLTRFKAIPLPLRGGLTAHMYALYAIRSDAVKVEYVTIVDPTSEATLSAARVVSETKTDGTRSYGAWARVQSIDDLQGYATSASRYALSDKQRLWWRRAALRHGLDPSAADELTQRQFAALPILVQTGWRFA